MQLSLPAPVVPLTSCLHHVFVIRTPCIHGALPPRQRLRLQDHEVSCLVSNKWPEWHHHSMLYWVGSIRLRLAALLNPILAAATKTEW